MSNIEVLSESEVTKENLVSLFKRAFMSTSFDDDDDLVVQTDGPRVYVTIDEEKKLLKYMAIYGVNESSSLELKYALTNKMNDNFIFGRFSIPEQRPDMLVADYYLPYEEGIPTFQIVSAVRLFAKVVQSAIRASDDNDLVE